MKNVPQHITPEEYARLSFLFPGEAPEPGIALQNLPGPAAVLGVHLNDSDGAMMRRVVRDTQVVCDALGDQLSRLILIHADTPPPSLAAHPKTALFTDFDLANDRFADLMLEQRRIVMVGWDARACVMQTLDAVAAMLPDAEAELQFPLGPLHDEKMDEAESTDDARVLLVTLIGAYARRVSRIRGIADVAHNGVYLSRHGEGDPPTRLLFHPSAETFAASLKP
jgi:hypothetical protein